MILMLGRCASLSVVSHSEGVCWFISVSLCGPAFRRNFLFVVLCNLIVFVKVFLGFCCAIFVDFVL